MIHLTKNNVEKFNLFFSSTSYQFLNILAIINLLLIASMLTTNFFVGVNAQTASPVDCEISSFTVNVSNFLSASARTFTMNFNDPGLDSKTIVLTGIVQYGQTLVIDGLQRLGMSCGAIITVALLCPGSTVIVKNSQLSSFGIASSEGAGNTCSSQCGFPSGIDETNIPLDTDPSYMTNISIFNNKVVLLKGDAIGFSSYESKDCVIFNNTRYQIQVYNNNIEIDSGVGILVRLRNMIGIQNSSDVYLSFLRNFLVRNNTFKLVECADPLNWIKNFVFTVPLSKGSSDTMTDLAAVGAEGSFAIDRNVVTQQCTDHVVLGGSSPTIDLRLTTFGANPAFLPLRVNISNNNIQGAQTWGFVSFVLFHARVGYYPNGYTFTRSNSNFVQTKNPSRRKDYLEILPSLNLAPIVIIENNILFSENALVERFINIEYLVDSRSPEIRGFIESTYSSSSSLRQALNTNSTLFNLYWYPESEIFGSVQIRNNKMTAFLPVKPLSYWISGANGTNADFVGVMLFVNVGNLIKKAQTAVLTNINLPVDRITGQLLLSAQNKTQYNCSSLMYTLEKVVVENNFMNATGIHAPQGVTFSEGFRAQKALVRNCSFHFDMTQSGNRKVGKPGELGQFFFGIVFGFPATIEAVAVSDSSWNVQKLTLPEKTEHEAGTYFESTGIFGLVSFKFNNNKCFGRFVSMQSFCKMHNFYSNHYTSAFDFSALLKSKFIPSYEFCNLSFDLSQSDPEVVSAGQNAIMVATLMLPTGSIVFDNISFVARSRATSRAVILNRNVVVECDSFVISNVNYLLEGITGTRAVDIQAPHFFVRKEIIITNISAVVRPFVYGSYLFSTGGLDSRPIAAVSLLANFYDPTTSTNSISSPFPKSMYKNPPVGQGGAIADKPIYFEISNIFVKVDQGVVMQVGAVYLGARGLNCRSTSTNNNNNNNNNEISLVMKNLTIYAAFPDSDLNSISDLVVKLGAPNAPVDRSVITIGVWPTPNWTWAFDTYVDSWGPIHDPRVGQSFPDSSSIASSTPQTITVEDAVQLADYRARSVGVNVVLLELVSDTSTAEKMPDVTSSQPTVVITLPPKIITRNIRSETAIIPSVFPPGTSWASSNASFNPNQVISVTRSPTDFQVPALDEKNLASVSPTTFTSSFVTFRSGVSIETLTLQNIFAPLFRQLWDVSYASFAKITQKATATSGLQKLIISPPSSSFTEINYENFLKFHLASSDNTIKNKINKDYLKNIGTCGVFFGNRPISNEDRVISTMAGSSLSPFNKKPISVHSKNYFDQIQFTPCLTETKSKSMSKTRHHDDDDRGQSRTSETISQSSTKVVPPVKNPMIETVSQSVASALVANDVLQTTSMVSVAVFASISSSPALGFTIAHQQAMLDFAKKAMQGDCRGLLPVTTTEEFSQTLSNPLGAADSPTQMSIGGENKLMSYYVGAVIGNFILAFSLVILSQGIGTVVMMVFQIKNNKIRNFTRNNVAFQMMKERCGFRKDEDLVDSMRRVFATSYVSLTLFFCLSFLLTPTLSSSLVVLVAAKNDPNLKNHEVSMGLKIVALIFALIFSAICVAFVAWGVLIRKQRKEKYRLNKLSRAEQEQVGIVAKMCKAEGEWTYPNPSGMNIQNIFDNNKKSKNNNINNKKYELCYLNFLIAEPTFESYRDTIWFSLVEVATAILIALPPFFAQFATSGRSSCLVHGIMLLIFILVYTVSLIWKNPFKMRIMRIMKPVLSLQQLVIVAMTLALVVMNGEGDTDDDQKKDSWLWKVIIIPMGFQGLMGVMMIGAAFFPFVMFLKKLKGRMQRNEAPSKSLMRTNNNYEGGRDNHHFKGNSSQSGSRRSHRGPSNNSRSHLEIELSSNPKFYDQHQHRRFHDERDHNGSRRSNIKSSPEHNPDERRRQASGNSHPRRDNFESNEQNNKRSRRNDNRNNIAASSLHWHGDGRLRSTETSRRKFIQDENL